MGQCTLECLLVSHFSFFLDQRGPNRRTKVKEGEWKKRGKERKKKILHDDAKPPLRDLDRNQYHALEILCNFVFFFFFFCLFDKLLCSCLGLCCHSCANLHFCFFLVAALLS